MPSVKFLDDDRIRHYYDNNKEVGTAIAEREGYPIGWGTFLRYALPGMIVVVGLCHLYLVLRYA